MATERLASAYGDEPGEVARHEGEVDHQVWRMASP